MAFAPIIRGDTYEFIFKIKYTDDNGDTQYVDMTGGNVFFTVKEKEADTDANAKIKIKQAATGTSVTITVPSTTTKNLVIKDHFADIQYVASDGTVITPFIGTIEVTRDATQGVV